MLMYDGTDSAKHFTVKSRIGFTSKVVGIITSEGMKTLYLDKIIRTLHIFCAWDGQRLRVFLTAAGTITLFITRLTTQSVPSPSNLEVYYAIHFSMSKFHNFLAFGSNHRGTLGIHCWCFLQKNVNNLYSRILYLPLLASFIILLSYLCLCYIMLLKRGRFAF